MSGKGLRKEKAEDIVMRVTKEPGDVQFQSQQLCWGPQVLPKALAFVLALMLLRKQESSSFFSVNLSQSL